MIQEGEVIFKKKSTVGLPKDVREFSWMSHRVMRF